MDLLQEFYYGDGLKLVLKDEIFNSNVDFTGLAGDNNTFDIDVEILDNDYNVIKEVTLTGEFSDNLVIMKNNDNNKTLVYKIKTGEFIY